MLATDEQGWWDWLLARSRKVPGSPEWVPWAAPGDGDEAGNPILSARAVDLSRAVRIIQHAPAADDPDVVFASWAGRYPPEFDDLPRVELVLSLVASPTAVQRAGRLLDAWLRDAGPAQLRAIDPGHEPGPAAPGPADR